MSSEPIFNPILKHVWLSITVVDAEQGSLLMLHRGICLGFPSIGLCRRLSGPASIVGLLTLCLFAGCGGNPGGGVPVTGNITFNGEPLEQGSIAFHDELGTTVALGLIKRGYYSMDQSASFAGVRPGKYTVSILSWIERPGTESATGKISKGISRIPQMYTVPTTSGLTADVGPSGEKLDFEVKDAAGTK